MRELLSNPIVVTGHVQDYAWGMGEESLVHRFSGEKTGNGRYAELWFGSHPNGQAKIVGDAREHTLSDIIQRHPNELLGETVAAVYGSQLPFLFKILSVGSALSIQTHPDEEFARVLHSRDPEHYADANPKPEVGIALSPVELLYGFRPVDDICKFLVPGSKEVIELVDLMGNGLAATAISGQLSDEVALERMYRAVMEASPEEVRQQSMRMFDRISSKPESVHTPEERWIMELQETYPEGDVGLFSMYLLNLVTVPEGKALYIGPNIPHAYLKNELAECMAPSDNVVRAGLTPKFIDIDTLLGMLDYSAQPPTLLDAVPSEQQGYGEFPVPLDRYFTIGVAENANSPLVFQTDSKIEMIVATGESSLSVNGQRQQLQAGRAAIIPALVSQYEVEVQSGKLFRVRVP